MQKVLVIGSGYMASEYLKVLNHLNVDVTVIGRGEKKVNELSSQYENFKFFSGGLSNFLNSNPNLENYLIINSVNVKFLRQTTIELIDAGANNILLEKPGDISGEGLRIIKEKSESHNCKVSIAYNRRFYSSLKKLISETKIDGGITSLHIEFTEWIHRIPLENFHTETLKKWILANSSHIIDMAFFLIGKPKELNSIVSGENNISWHPSGSIFTGSGLSNQNIPFTYHSNWESAGRWQIEVQT